MRSAPAVMVPQMSSAFGLTPVGVASLVGLFYYAYAPFSSSRGRMDRSAARSFRSGATVAVTADVRTGDPTSRASAVPQVPAESSPDRRGYIATTISCTRGDPDRRTQCLAWPVVGRAAAVGPAMANGLQWDQFWLWMGIAGVPIALLLFVFIPSRQKSAPRSENWLSSAGRAMGAVFINPQSILCGLIAGLLFIPTTIFDMVWGVRFLQEAHDVPYSVAACARRQCRSAGSSAVLCLAG